MNKGTLVMILLALAFALTACSLGGSSGTASEALTPESKLALGTLRLENTEQAIDSKEAAELLPLWQLLDELKSNEAAAQAEIDAVVEKIQLTMTADQIQAINKMGLTQADATVISESQSTSSSTATNKSSSSQSSAAGGPAMAGGMPLDPGGMPPGGPSSSSGQSSTASKSQTSNDTTSLVQQVIKLLESKMQN
jgi:hypothetical protein